MSGLREAAEELLKVWTVEGYLHAHHFEVEVEAIRAALAQPDTRARAALTSLREFMVNIVCVLPDSAVLYELDRRLAALPEPAAPSVGFVEGVAALAKDLGPDGVAALSEPEPAAPTPSFIVQPPRSTQRYWTWDNVEHCWLTTGQPAPAPVAAQPQEPEPASDAETAKDLAYSERDRLVQALSKLFPSHLMRHPDSDTEWDDDWRWIVCITLPTGQATWHIPDSERDWFSHLIEKPNDWDGHSTEQKYARLVALQPKPASDAKCEDCNGTGRFYMTPTEWQTCAKCHPERYAEPASDAAAPNDGGASMHRDWSGHDDCGDADAPDEIEAWWTKCVCSNPASHFFSTCDPVKFPPAEQRDRLRDALAATRAEVAVKVAALHDLSAELTAASEERERMRSQRDKALALFGEGQAMKTHDLAIGDSWVIDDVEGVRALLAAQPQEPEPASDAAAPYPLHAEIDRLRAELATLRSQRDEAGEEPKP